MNITVPEEFLRRLAQAAEDAYLIYEDQLPATYSTYTEEEYVKAIEENYQLGKALSAVKELLGVNGYFADSEE